MLAAESGRCQHGNDPHRRWYYDDLRGNCVNFIYNGCGGNQNNFRSYEDCIGFCRPSKFGSVVWLEGWRPFVSAFLFISHTVYH